MLFRNTEYVALARQTTINSKQIQRQNIKVCLFILKVLCSIIYKLCMYHIKIYFISQIQYFLCKLC